MSRVAILKIGRGDFHQGFEVSLELREDGGSPVGEIEGKLRANTEIEGLYFLWQQSFRNLTAIARNHGWEIEESLPTNRATSEIAADCWQRMQQVEANLNQWLQPSGELGWQKIRERLSKELASQPDTMRLGIKAKDPILWKLPWHTWDLLSSYPNVGVSYSPIEYESWEIAKHQTQSDRVRLLAIFGDNRHLDLEGDREAIKSLEATSVFCHQPQARDLIAQLRDPKGWDIFFFAGHSQTIQQRGQISLSARESIETDQFKHALREAIQRGLRIAIFNSCEGLGLAQQLADLHVPIIIVMQEIVPDLVAQSFLKEFLREYAAGQPLYTAVRRAQERLEEFTDLPGATWLPMIYHNPSQVPPTWKDLQPVAKGNSHRRLDWQHLPDIFIRSLLATGLVMAVRFLGGLQPMELWAFDQMTRLQPDRGIDERLLVVKVTEKDIREQRQYPLSDRVILQAIQKLQVHQPRAIGLDIYRDLPVEPGYTQLAAHLKENPRLVTICEVSQSEAKGKGKFGVASPPASPPENTGFSDLVVDSDGIVRRYLFHLNSGDSLCQVSYAFSAQLAFRYLDAEGIQPEATSEGHLQLGSTVFEPLEKHTGFYHNIDPRGHQVLLSYRSSQKVAREVTLAEVLKNNFQPEWVKDRIVLIGVMESPVEDSFFTPFSKEVEQEMAGIVIHAQMVSQILSVAQQKRPLLRFWPQELDTLWIWSWSFAGGLCVWGFDSLVYRRIAIATVITILSSLCFGLFAIGMCAPLVPSALALAIAWIVTTHLKRGNSNQV